MFPGLKINFLTMKTNKHTHTHTHTHMTRTRVNTDYCILYLHRALNNVTQSANQHMHTFFIKTYLKFLKTLLHVSVIRPSSGSL